MGLYQAELGLLLCPCHQSTFDVMRHAKPIFGPAARSLPQLPLAVDDDGFIIATGTSPPRSARASGTAGGDADERAGRAARPVGRRLYTHRIARWIDGRLGAAKFARTALNKVFPDNWSFMLGELALYSFVVLVLTGIYLTFFFDASSNQVVYTGSYAPLRGVEMTQAYRSALELSFDVRAGLVMRQIHHWAALLFLAAITVHLARVFFTSAFRRPREINWIIGCTLLPLALFNGLFGYSLLDDQLSGTGLRIVYGITLSIPLGGHLGRVAAVRRRVPRPGHHPAAVRHPHPAGPGAHRRPHRPPPGDIRPPQAHPVPGPGRRETTSSARGSGRPMRSRRWVCSS